jgi:hypothetical protein|tara:strand:+ start:923 stop:1183 length:261 start_codon:yes stop_codon:yes gene_type:complete
MASSRNNALEFSSVGSIVINAADGATAGTFGAIQFLKDSEIDEVISTNITNASDLQTTFAAGTILYGNFTSVTVTGAGSLVQLHKV